MKLLPSVMCGLAFLGLTSTQALAAGWQLTPATAGHGLQLTYSAGETPSYLFACGASDITVTNFGVTELLDIQTGQKIADAPGSVITPGAAVMAIFIGKGQPDFMPAETVQNAVKGWDMTIHLGKDDKQIKALAKAKMLSLFTTGYTMAVEMDGTSQGLMRDFVKQCSAPAA